MQISGHSAKSYVLQHLKVLYKESCDKTHSHIDKSMARAIPRDSAELVRLVEKSIMVNSQLNAVSIPTNIYLSTPQKLAEEWKSGMMADYLRKLKNLKSKEDELRFTAEQNYYNDLKQKKEYLDFLISEYKDKKLSSIYLPIMKLRDNRDKVMEFAEANGIDLQGFSLDFDVLRLKDLKAIALSCGAALDNVVEGRKGVSILLYFLYLPLLYNPFADNAVSNMLYKTMYFVMLFAACAYAFPYTLAVISLLIIVHSLAAVMQAKQKEQLLSIAYFLSYNFEVLDEFITSHILLEPDVSKAEEEYLKLEYADLEDIVAQAVSGVSQNIASHESTSQESEYDAQVEDACSIRSKDYYTAELCNLKTLEEQSFAKTKADYAKYLNGLLTEIDYRAANAKGPGMPVNEDYVLSTEFKTSSISFGGRHIDYGRVTVPFANILFEYNEEAARPAMIDTMKLLLSNALGNVREKYLYVTVVDIEGLGRSMAEFFKPELSEYITIINRDFDKQFEAFVDKAKSNMLRVGTKSFSEYNRDNAKLGKVTLDYQILIVLSTDRNLYENRLFIEFKNYSTSMGVWVWLVHGHKDLYIKDKKHPEGIADLLDFPVKFKNPNYFFYAGKKHELCVNDGKHTKIDYTVSVGESAANNLIATMRANRMPIIDYESQYRQRHIPDSKIWSYTTLEYIELHFGFRDGDASNPEKEILGDEPVHCLMAGQTGAGKSATINQVLANLLHMYSPSQLTLIMIDFKNVEFNMYTGDLLIPHAKIIAGTTDGEYALSIFDYLMEEMNSRKKQFAKYKFQKLEDYNRAILEGKINEEYMPRILVLLDEFQVMFTEVEDKIVEIIKARIRSLSKLARFCGCHLWFTSQSMKGTMSADILDQFGLRACLQCSEETSLDVLGNRSAFNELKARGSILTNNKRGNINDNHRYSIPFASNKYIKEYIPRLIKGGKEGKFSGYKHWQADFYDENKKHSILDLKKVYDIDVINTDERIIVLGERTSYSTNKLPCNIRLLKDQGEHIIIAGLNRDDRFNIMAAMLYNINRKKRKNVIISCLDMELAGLLDIDKQADPDLVDFLYCQDYKVIFNMLEEIISVRSKDPVKDWKPTYLFALAWDRLAGVGVGEDYDAFDRLKMILQKSGGLDLHIILLTRLSKPFNSFLPFFNHKICAQSDENTSSNMLDNMKGMSLSMDENVSRMAIHKIGISEMKFKIYQSEISENRIQKRDVVIVQ